MRKKMLIALMGSAALSSSALAADYYVVVPLPGKTPTAEAPSAPLAPTITLTLNGYPLPAARVGRAYAGFDFNTVLQVSGDASFSGQAVSWEVVGGALPVGLTLSANGVLSGMPIEAGTASFQVKATYETASGTQAFELLSGEVSVALASAALPAAVQGAAYSYDFKPQIIVSGDPAYTLGQVVWTLDGTLPQGLVFNADGTITGVPTAEGSYPFTVRAQYLNKEGARAYQVLVGEIVVSLAAVTAPSGVVGQAYAGVDLKPLVSVTGDAAYAGEGLIWRVAAGALPAGLTLSEGTISGTPSAKAAGPATVEVSYKGKTAQQPVTIAVSDSLKQFSGYRAWSDGTLAVSCLEYKQGKTGYVYAGATGDGVYRIQPGGAAVNVLCDMTTEGGGWTLIMTNNLPNFTNASGMGTSAVCTTLTGCNTGGTSNFYLNTPVEGQLKEFLFAATSTGNPMEHQWRLTNPAPFIRDNTPTPGVSLFRLMTDNDLGWVPASEIGVEQGGDRNLVERMFTGTYGTWSDGNWHGFDGRQGLNIRTNPEMMWGHHHYSGYTFDGTNYTIGSWTFYPYSGGPEAKVISKHAAEQLHRWSIFVR